MAIKYREAMHYQVLDAGRLRCRLCPHECVLCEGQMGLCKARKTIKGKLYALNYAKTVSLALDPIEKKPLYHYYPNSQILSLGPNSCNLSCSFCQNYQISQFQVPTHTISPRELGDKIRQHSPQDLQVAFTYTEPFTWYEYIYDFARENPDIRVVLISNGFILKDAFAQILPYIDAMNIDLKSFQDDFYKKQCGGKLQPVLDSITLAAGEDVHLEITLLLIPSLNDSEAEIRELAGFIASVNPDTPLHISAYHPDYQMQIPATQNSLILKAIKIARQELHYVYGGNMRDSSQMQTYCPACKTKLIERDYFLSISHLNGGNCPKCGHKIYGRF